MAVKTYSNPAIRTYNVKSQVELYASRLPDSFSDIIADVYEKADTTFNDKEQKDNLLSTDRTVWNIDHEYPDELRPVIDEICKFLMNVFVSKMQSTIDFNAQIVGSWIARSKKGAVVDPHHHGHNPVGWSFCYYAKIPSGSSSLTFMDAVMGSKTQVMLSEGDLLFFPSSLTHYTADTEDGRLIFSGNVLIDVREADPNSPPPLTQEQIDEQKVY